MTENHTLMYIIQRRHTTRFHTFPGSPPYELITTVFMITDYALWQCHIRGLRSTPAHISQMFSKHTNIIATILLTTFSNVFSSMKQFAFDLNFTEVSSQGSNLQYGNIVSIKSLTPNRRQAITWTEDFQVYRPRWVQTAQYNKVNVLLYIFPIEHKRKFLYMFHWCQRWTVTKALYRAVR